MAALGRFFARSTKAVEETVPLVSREAEAEANAAGRISHANGEEGRRWMESAGRTAKTVLYAAPPVAIAGGIGYSVYKSWDIFPKMADNARKDIGKGAHDLGVGLEDVIEKAMHLPAEIAKGIPGIPSVSGGQLEFVAFTVVALGAGFVLIHYVTN